MRPWSGGRPRDVDVRRLHMERFPFVLPYPRAGGTRGGARGRARSPPAGGLAPACAAIAAALKHRLPAVP
ncbi:uncharacterized protein STAUR_6852 [Stigmatella aurantiaca DW4/3-1]|uniref:Uncharacterized protein n=1 Tax=Stigmatella aurantiaca (strain DW4/3-1) TaxID=378806 RepID=E3FSY5_STIAD|nr:uncharacterized protein STAUR_6852 [Stigmatella aurantiaca DW4/3-1]